MRCQPQPHSFSFPSSESSRCPRRASTVASLASPVSLSVCLALAAVRNHRHHPAITNGLSYVASYFMYAPRQGGTTVFYDRSSRPTRSLTVPAGSGVLRTSKLSRMDVARRAAADRANYISYVGHCVSHVSRILGLPARRVYM
ncbi:hypothetical protein DFH06DRAFT_1325113 [Mycena polygramma]|nr:hypothetical protein DFH06DRAFT_1325113 [Mycena polygramma]